MPKILVLLSMVVCCGGSRTTLPVDECIRTVRLEIDSLFSDVERKEIIKAIHEWESASEGRLCLKTTWRDTSKDVFTFRHDGKYILYSRHRKWQIDAVTSTKGSPCPKRDSCLGATIWEHGGFGSDIFVLTAKVEFIRATVIHELGHVFGLKHTYIYDSIMFETIRKDKVIGEVDKKKLNCLIKTSSLLKSENSCVREDHHVEN